MDLTVLTVCGPVCFMVTDNLRTQVMEALSGAVSVREQLVHALALAIGRKSFVRPDRAHAIKGRIKADSLIRKVLDNKAYNPDHATDIIGRYFVSNYRLLFQSFLTLLETDNIRTSDAKIAPWHIGIAF
jgi:hypothetical protein